MEHQPANASKNLLLELLFFSVLLIAVALESYKIFKASFFPSKHPKTPQLSNKTRIFLTGSSGNMGFETFKVLYENGYRLVLLNLDTPQARKMFSQYKSDPNVKLYWGNLMNYTDVLNCVSQSDFVLHVGGMVSPYADYYPTKTLKTNVLAAENIVKAVKNISSEIKVVYIGSVSQTGDRNPPIHWGRTGDPIKISVYDHYAISKTIAERIFAESGLPFWVSLRQSAIIYPRLVKNLDPIMYHIPIKGVLEWSTIEDSANLMLKIVSTELPYEFWRSFYNIGSGDEYRLTNYEITEIVLDIMGFPARKVFDSNWFVLKNFHGHWFADSDVLENWLHFRLNIPAKEYFKNFAKKISFLYRLAKLVPSILAKKLVMEPLTKKRIFGTMSWIQNSDQNRISSYFGNVSNWENIPSWDKFDLSRPNRVQAKLNHGFNESKPEKDLDLEDMKEAAKFRGGEVLSDSMLKGDLFTPLKWKCGFGHVFEMTPNLVLKGGHWCPKELPFPWNYDEEAKLNPFFSQVWYPMNEKNENHFYNTSIYHGIEDF